MDLLKELGCNIDFKNKLLRTYNTKIPICFDYLVKRLKIEPNCDKFITIKTNYMDGNYICDDFNWFKGLKSPAAVVTVKNGIFKTSIKLDR